MIGHIPEVIAAGADSLKLEGRAKTSYYTAVHERLSERAGRGAAGRSPDPVWLEEVNKVSHRRYGTGFFFGRQRKDEFYEDARYLRAWSVAALVESCDETGEAVLTQKNRFESGEELELLAPGMKPVRFRADGLRDAEGNPIATAPHPGMPLRLRLPAAVSRHAILRRENGKIRTDRGQITPLRFLSMMQFVARLLAFFFFFVHLNRFIILRFVFSAVWLNNTGSDWVRL